MNKDKLSLSELVENLSKKYDNLIKDGEIYDISELFKSPDESKTNKLFELFGINAELLGKSVDIFKHTTDEIKEKGFDMFNEVNETIKDKTKVDFVDKLKDLGFDVKIKPNSESEDISDEFKSKTFKKFLGKPKSRKKAEVVGTKLQQKKFPYESVENPNGNVSLYVALGCVDPAYLSFDLNEDTNEVTINYKIGENKQKLTSEDFTSNFIISDSYDVTTCTPFFKLGVVELVFSPKEAKKPSPVKTVRF